MSMRPTSIFKIAVSMQTAPAATTVTIYRSELLDLSIMLERASLRFPFRGMEGTTEQSEKDIERRGLLELGFQTQTKAGFPAFVIIRYHNTFVYCFVQLNKQGRALVRVLVPGFDKALMGPVERN